MSNDVLFFKNEDLEKDSAFQTQMLAGFWVSIICGGEISSCGRNIKSIKVV